MIRALIIASALLGCAACAETGEGNAWYQHGDTTYDSVKSASDDCKAKGGDFHLKPNGDATHMADYACDKPKGS
jgi:hypothetical protein